MLRAAVIFAYALGLHVFGMFTPYMYMYYISI